MKRSEAVNRVADLLEAYSGPAKLRAERLLNELSESLAFEPEEEPLPERLEVKGGSLRDCASLGILNPYIADARSGYRGKDGTAAALRVLREAVRRWNAWEALEKLSRWHLQSLAEAGLLDYLKRFRAILDGKEGE